MEQLSPHANNMGTSEISVTCYFFVVSKLPTDFSMLQSGLGVGAVLCNLAKLIRQIQRRETSSQYVI